MKTTDLSFELPSELIASRPVEGRDTSRLMRVSKDGQLWHGRFNQLVFHLNEGDLLVMNDTKVMPVRLRVRKPSGGIVDLMLVKEISEGLWEILCKSKYNGEVLIGDNIVAHLSSNTGQKTIRFDHPVDEILRQHGLMPLPPYIKRIPDERDKTDYQTIYASKEGSIAAPTAGLHFTEKLIKELKGRGVEIETLTLHVGKGTFMPIRSSTVSDHKMESEGFVIKKPLIEKIEKRKSSGSRVIAVGTTTTRALEALFSGHCVIETSSNGSIYGSTDLFIYPGYEFKAIDGMITNFHLPGSTPLVLVCSLLGIEKTKEIYRIAIKEGYRFFSYGDAMLIL